MRAVVSTLTESGFSWLHSGERLNLTDAIQIASIVQAVVDLERVAGAIQIASLRREAHPFFFPQFWFAKIYIIFTCIAILNCQKF